MKKILLILLLVSCLILCACARETDVPESEKSTSATQDSSSEAPTLESTKVPTSESTAKPASPTQPDPSLEENSAYTPYAERGGLGIILNAPFEGSEPEASVRWREGKYERAYIIPRYIGSSVYLYHIEWSEDYSEYALADAPEYFCADIADGCVIFSVLERAEGVANSYLKIVAPNGEVGGMLLQYNGNTGTPAIETIVPSYTNH